MKTLELQIHVFSIAISHSIDVTNNSILQIRKLGREVETKLQIRGMFIIQSNIFDGDFFKKKLKFFSC